LSLMLLVSAGVGEPLLALMDQRLGSAPEPSIDPGDGPAPGNTATFDTEPPSLPGPNSFFGSPWTTSPPFGRASTAWKSVKPASLLPRSSRTSRRTRSSFARR
jgi:hypothetical protein